MPSAGFLVIQPVSNPCCLASRTAPICGKALFTASATLASSSLRTMKNKEVWKFVIQTAISVLSAIATALSVTSCMT